MSQSFNLFDMSWPEVKSSLDTVKVALIPTGSCEQHGPNGTFEVDTAIAGEFARRLAERTYPLTLAVPPVHFGVSTHHMKFPGTITLKPETFMQVCMDVVESLYRHGLRRFIFVNGHGGNVASLTVVLAKIKYAYPDAQIALASPWCAQEVIKDRIESTITGHACEIEMSMCLYLAPGAVKTASLTKGAVKVALEEYKNPLGIVIAKSWDENTENGALGDATKSSRDIGEAAVEAALERMAGFVAEFSER